MSRILGTLKKILLVVTFSLLALEGASRLVLQVTAPEWKERLSNLQPFGRNLATVHPYFGYTLTEIGPADEDRYAALRGNLPARNPGVFTLGVTGGSVAEHFAFQMSRSGYLERKLKAQFPELAKRKIVVVNLSQEGQKQPQTFHIVSHLMSRLDYVISIDGENEMNQSLPKVYPKDYPLYLFVPFVNDLAAQARLGLLHWARFHWLRAEALWTSPFLQHSGLARLTWLMTKATLNEWVSASFSQLDTEFYELDSQQARSERLAIWREFSVRLARLLKMEEIGYAFFIQPNQYVAGGKPLSDEEKRSSFSLHLADYKRESYELLDREVAALQNAGVRYFSLTHAFRNVQDTLYIDDCCHINPRGNELIADALILELKKHGL